jgi:hypothetical protein
MHDVVCCVCTYGVVCPYMRAIEMRCLASVRACDRDSGSSLPGLCVLHMASLSARVCGNLKSRLNSTHHLLVCIGRHKRDGKTFGSKTPCSPSK